MRGVAQIAGYGCYRIGLLDSEPGDWQKRRVSANKRDVSAVKRGHHRQMPDRLKHLARKVGTHRVGNSVVHVQQIEMLGRPRPGRALMRARRCKAGTQTAGSLTCRPGENGFALEPVRRPTASAERSL